MLMRSDVELKNEDFEAALKTLESVYNLPQVQDPSAPIDNVGMKKYSIPYGI